uniref:Uncharacterized protein n=1 Tax=Cacopsylla melanoneura TaxID=428564 RepID=A0A8D8XEX1_9HEMI
MYSFIFSSLTNTGGGGGDPCLFLSFFVSGIELVGFKFDIDFLLCARDRDEIFFALSSFFTDLSSSSVSPGWGVASLMDDDLSDTGVGGGGAGSAVSFSAVSLTVVIQSRVLFSISLKKSFTTGVKLNSSYVLGM